MIFRYKVDVLAGWQKKGGNAALPDKIKPTMLYEVKAMCLSSECPLYDIALNDIRQVFEATSVVQEYYPENVLQARTDFKNNDRASHLLISTVMQ